MGDPVGLSHLYAKNMYNYAHSPVFRPLIIRLCGRSLIWVQGKEHKRMRGLVAPAFAADNVLAMHTDIYHISTALQTALPMRFMPRVSAPSNST